MNHTSECQYRIHREINSNDKKKKFSFTNSNMQVITLAEIRNDIGFGKMGALMCCQEPYKLVHPFFWVIWQNSSDKNIYTFYQAISLWGIYIKEIIKDILEDLEVISDLNYDISI